jgi:hypothetical protein
MADFSKDGGLEEHLSMRLRSTCAQRPTQSGGRLGAENTPGHLISNREANECWLLEGVDSRQEDERW